MSFISIEFLVLFLPVFIAVLYFGGTRYRKYYLCFFSTVFYGWCGLYYLLLLLLSSAVVFCLTGCMFHMQNTKRKKLLLSLILIYVLGALSLYKFLPEILPPVFLTVLPGASSPAASILLPMGISFYSLSLISYTLDVYYERSHPAENFFNLYLYVSYFPKIVQGPLHQYSDFDSQLKNGQNIRMEHLDQGMEYFVKGMFKKVMIADQIMPVASFAFEHPDSAGTCSVWISALAYCLVLYYDFSGYSDMAVGLGMMSGFSLPVNFDHPYLSGSVSEFWRRWHISLGEWFKNYVYTPCFRTITNRKDFSKKMRFSADLFSLFLVWVLIGLWHGSGWKYLFYGMWWFLFIALERIKSSIDKKRKKNGIKPVFGRFGKAIGHGYTFFAVVLGFVILKADTLKEAFRYWWKMFGGQSDDRLFFLSRFSNQLVCAAVLGIVFLFPVYGLLKKHVFDKNRLTKTIYRLTLVALFAVVFFFAVSGGKSSFLYEIY